MLECGPHLLPCTLSRFLSLRLCRISTSLSFILTTRACFDTICFCRIFFGNLIFFGLRTALAHESEQHGLRTPSSFHTLRIILFSQNEHFRFILGEVVDLTLQIAPQKLLPDLLFGKSVCILCFDLWY
jgi:hypothetical protein